MFFLPDHLSSSAIAFLLLLLLLLAVTLFKHMFYSKFPGSQTYQEKTTQ